MQKVIKFHFVRPHLWWLPFSLLVRWFTNSNFSHVGVEIQENFVSDASGAEGVKTRYKSTWIEKYNIIETIELPVTYGEFLKAAKFASDNLNRDYSFKQIASIALRKLGIIRSNRWGDGDRSFICSEFATRVLESMDIRLTDQSAEFISPRKLYALLNTYLSSNVYEFVPKRDR